MGGELDPPLPLKDGQHYRIQGSALNDGVCEHPAGGLEDEEFEGRIHAMRLPPDFMAIAGEIAKWNEKNGAFDSAANSPYQSESFGGYSYSKGGGASGGGGAGPPWAAAFGGRLERWRKL